jgi:hypothetical protein
MGTLNTGEILRFAATGGSSNLPEGFIPVAADKLVLPLGNQSARIEYSAWYNATTNELVLTGKALPQPIGGDGMGGPPTVADAGIFHDSTRRLQGPYAGAFIDGKPIAVAQTEAMVGLLVNPDSDKFPGAKVILVGSDAVGLTFASSSYNLRSAPDTNSFIDGTVTFNSWRGPWTSDGSKDTGVIDVRTSNPANGDPFSQSFMLAQPGGVVLRVSTGDALVVGAVTDIAVQSTLDGIGGLLRDIPVVGYPISKLIDWGKEFLTDTIANRVVGAIDSPNKAADLLGWVGNIPPGDTSRAVTNNLSQGQYNVQNGLSPSGYLVNSTAFENVGNPVIVGVGPSAITRQATVLVTTYVDSASGAVMEARVGGQLENGSFVASSNSTYVMGMDTAGRTVMTGATAFAVAKTFNLDVPNSQGTVNPENSLDSIFKNIAPDSPVSLSIHQTRGEYKNPETGATEMRNVQSLEFKNTRGDTAWVLEKAEGTKTLILHIEPDAVRPYGYKDGGTLELELDKNNKSTGDFKFFGPDGELRMQPSDWDAFFTGIAPSLDLKNFTANTTNSPTDPEFFVQTSGNAAQIELNGRIYTRSVNGDYQINLGDGQYDIYDRGTGVRYLETNGTRIPVNADESIFQQDTGQAFIAPKYVPQTSAVTQITNQQVTGVLNDISGLISAIQGGKPFPILNSGVHLVNTLANPAGSAISYPGLNMASGALSGLASLYSLSNAFRYGNDLTKLNATLSTLNYVNSTLPGLLSAGAAPLSPALNGFLNGTGTGAQGAFAGLGAGNVPGVLPVLGLVLSIKSGDPIGIAQGLIGLINPALLTSPIGWALIGVQILRTLMNEPPEAWGNAKVIFDADGHITIDTVGEAFGPQRVRQQLQGTLNELNAMITQVKAASPDTPIGIVPQRMPSIMWREARRDDKGYTISDIDPITGAQRYPFLRFEQPVATTDLIAYIATFYWSTGLKDIKNRAENDEFWRHVA